MLKYSYHKEIYNQLTQFTAAFDDCFLYRYTKDGEAKEKINVRYVFGPKQRVLYDIVNPAKNIDLPVISIEQTNLRRDSSRIQFKDQKITRPNKTNNLVSRVPTPIPVIMDINVSIVTMYKEDIDQIVCNFIPWCNPYFIISWKVPEEFGMDFVDELRTEVSWSGTVDFENPTNPTNSDKYRIIGNTSFTLKGWIFPALETPQAPIYVVTTNFISLSTATDMSSYSQLVLNATPDNTDVIQISAYPEFTNIFYKGIPVYEPMTIESSLDHTFTFYGKRLDFNNAWYLSGSPVVSYQFEEVVTAKFPTISAYRIPSEYVTTVNDNISYISLDSSQLSGGSFTVVTANSAGWVAWENTVSVF